MTDEKNTQIPDAEAIAQGAEVTKQMVEDYKANAIDMDKMWTGCINQNCRSRPIN